MTWKRARTPQQISERRQAIIEAAGQLFAGHEYHEVTFQAIARRAGIAKSNIYRYFESKEAIFVHIYLQELSRWIALFRQHMSGVATGDVTEFATATIASVVASPRLVELEVLLSGVLERNLSIDAAVDFKRAVLGQLEEVVKLVGKVFPSLPKARIQQLISLLHALIAGLHPAQVVTARLGPHLAAHGVNYPHIEFSTTLKNALELLLHGMLKEETHAR